MCLYLSESSFRIFIKSYNYAEGVKPLITPNEIRGEEAKQRTTPTELNFAG